MNKLTALPPLLRRIAWFLATVFVLAGAGFFAVQRALDRAAEALNLPDAQMLSVIFEQPTLLATSKNNGGFEMRCACPLLVAPQEIPQHLRAALVAIEDQRFWTHAGGDWIGLGRAVLSNVSSGRIEEGGSTLTQQLAKVIVGDERSLKRKLREFILAKRIESHFTKQQIIDYYLNRVYFGRGAWGIENAAREYFQKRAKDLSLYEAAVLVGMLQAPTHFDPTRHSEASHDRAKTVLERMVAQGSLREKEAARALVVGAKPGALESVDLAAGHYMAWIARQLGEINFPSGEPGTEWRIVVSLDIRRQLSAKRAIDRARDEALAHNAKEAALIAMNPEGMVQALIGGRDFSESQFDRATQALRQPGSTFKPFVYLAALEKGYRPSSLIADAPITIGDWSPENFDKQFLGTITLKDALAGSRNAATVRLARAVGFSRVADVAARFGLPAGGPAPFVLGAKETRLIDLTSAYASIAATGKRVRPQGIVAVLDPQGAVRYRAGGGKAKTIVSREHAAALTDMLRAAAKRAMTGGATPHDAFAGKTGTTQNYRDAWFVGFSGELAAGAWVGNDDGTPMAHVMGSSLPTQIWRDFMSDRMRTDGRR